MAFKGFRNPRIKTEDILHNHSSLPVIEYAGLSRTAPYYHLFRCVQWSKLPRRKVVLVPFDRSQFDGDSKAGKGGCSMRKCLFDAMMMSEQGHQAYCEWHAKRTQRRPCPWTNIELCYNKFRLDEEPNGQPCPMCTTLEKGDTMSVRVTLEVTCTKCKKVRRMSVGDYRSRQTDMCRNCSNLSQRRPNTVLLRWLREGKTYQKIADYYGISRQRVGQLALKANLRRRETRWRRS